MSSKRISKSPKTDASSTTRELPSLSAKAQEILRSAEADDAERADRDAKFRRWLPILGAASAARHFPDELQAWRPDEAWPSWTHRFDWESYPARWVRETWIPLIEGLHELAEKGENLEPILDTPCERADRELIRDAFRAIFDANGGEAAVVQAISSVHAVLTRKGKKPGYLNWEEQHRYFAALEDAIGHRMEELRTAGSVDASEASPNPSGSQLDAEHNTDFTWVRWFGIEHTFKKGIQAQVVRALWEEWEKGSRRDGRGLGQEALGKLAGSSSDSFSVRDNFRGHPAMDTMIRSVSKGVFALFRLEPAE